ncbi:MoaD/ThiS family protein [Chloroflexota bacterium]
MTVKVHFHGYITPLPNLVNIIDVRANTIGQCLAELIKKYPVVEKSLYDEKGKLNEHYVLLVDGSRVPADDTERHLADGKELHIVPLMGGG